MELEVRLTDTAADRDLVLLRSQEHSGSAVGAALEFGDDLARFLR